MTLRDLEFTDKQIADMLCMSKTSVDTRMRNQDEIPVKASDRRSNQSDDLFFHKIDTEEKAYLLGFIMADGCVYKQDLQFTIHRQDQYLLEWIKDILKSDSKITLHPNGPYCSLNVYSKTMSKDLETLNIVPNKSLKLQPPPKELIPDELYYHLIRGYFDGDGSIWEDKQGKNYRFNMVGTLDVLTEFRKQMGWKENTLRYANKGQYITYRMDYGGNGVCTRYLGQLYENATIYLTRKYEKYLSAKERYDKFLLNKKK